MYLFPHAYLQSHSPGNREGCGEANTEEADAGNLGFDVEDDSDSGGEKASFCCDISAIFNLTLNGY